MNKYKELITKTNKVYYNMTMVVVSYKKNKINSMFLSSD